MPKTETNALMNEEIAAETRFLTLTALITLCGFLLRWSGLSGLPLSGDDACVAISAVNYMEQGHLGPTMWNHPHFWNILVYAAMRLTGGGIWGLKLASLLLGTTTIALLILLARRIFNDERVALLAGFFLAIDPLHIDFSRQAVHEVYMAFFTLAGILLAMRFLDSMKPMPLLLSGICFGLGVASKWYVLFPLFITYAYLAWRLAREPGAARSEKGAALLFLSSALVLLPLTVYILTFIPWFRRGFDFSEWLSLQSAMLTATKTHAGNSAYYVNELDVKAWQWFVRPVAYADLAAGASGPRILLAITNPLVWLLTIPATVYLAIKGFKSKNGGFLFVVSLFWLTYLPFVMTNRPIWSHSAFSVLPFAFMATAFALIDGFCGRRHGKTMLAAYLCLVVVAATPLYLLATGKGHDVSFLQPVIEMYRPSHEK